MNMVRAYREEEQRRLQTFKYSDSEMEINIISCRELASKMKKESESILVIDCRPFISYNTDHISTSFNIYCPPIIKRRLAKRNEARIENMLNCETKKKLRNGVYRSLVVYDEDTQTVPDDSDLHFMCHNLYRFVGSKNCFCLQGGFRDFLRKYAHLCVSIRTAIPQQGQPGQAIEATDLKRKQRKRPSTLPLSKTTDPVELLPHLYIGDAFNASSKETLERLGITAVLNVSNNCQNYFVETFRYKNIPVDDNHSADLAPWFLDAIGFIDYVRHEQGKVLVHCQAGVSRSATICLAYVMSHKCLNMEEAFEFVKSRRTVISPNVNFLRQLMEFEKNIPCAKPNAVNPPVSPCRMFSVNVSSLDVNNSSGFSSIDQDLPSPFLKPSPVAMVASPVVTSS